MFSSVKEVRLVLDSNEGGFRSEFTESVGSCVGAGRPEASQNVLQCLVYVSSIGNFHRFTFSSPLKPSKFQVSSSDWRTIHFFIHKVLTISPALIQVLHFELRFYNDDIL